MKKQSEILAWEIGKQYFIRTVTHYNVGRLVAVTDTDLILDNAAWVADTGRFADALKSGDFKEIEPFPAGRINVSRSAYIDACIYLGQLPLSQK